MSIGKIILAVLLVSVLTGFTLAKTDQPKISNHAVVIAKPMPEVIVNGNKYSYYFYEADPRKTKLIGNFDQKKSTEDISITNNCVSGINGSFYAENWEPLAGWESEGNVRRKITHNNLLNGYIGFSNSNRLLLGRELPEEKMAWGMQTGPVLLSDGKLETLSLATDKPARRSVAGKTKTGNLIIFSVFSSESRYDGPTLSELPKVAAAINTQESLRMLNAINLDGGAASAFYSQNNKLPELVAVGSWICIQN